LSLLFAIGDRPSADDVARLLASSAFAGTRPRISHQPEASEGWLELLVSGLTFDLAGLVPAEGTALPPAEHQFGISFDLAQFRFEAITITPGRHIAGGGAMMPVARTLIGLAAGIAQPLPVKAVCWHPAHSLIEPGYFNRMVTNWLSGGHFPAQGLTALRPHEKGGYQTFGLDFFSGQELRIEVQADEPLETANQFASRIIDHIIRNGPLTSLYQTEGASGKTILAEPIQGGSVVRVWRNA
jgi:hypothetical protein